MRAAAMIESIAGRYTNSSVTTLSDTKRQLLEFDTSLSQLLDETAQT